MRRYDLFGLISLFCLLAACTPSQPEWRLVWEENFDQINDFDPAVWSKIPRGTADWNNYMSDFDSLYEMRNGNLVLRGIQNLTQPQDTAPFLTGGVYTKGKMGFMDGRLEIKAKLNGATGAWPAFWLLPQEGQWPMGGEIDIMERLNYDNIAYQTVHSHYTYDLGFKTTPPQGSTGPIHPEAYNVYAVEMYADSLCFFINDQHTFTYPRIETDQEGQFPFHQPFYLLLDMQLGGSWVGAVDPTELPVEMSIDWVRFYQK
ncbi:MAG: glycoside hydrolase family 16 protein [Parabacteroides sp.]|nr:glycoside hydrolase family 16 protein [Parabacteroides sp.]